MSIHDVKSVGKRLIELEPTSDEKLIWHRHNVLGETKRSIVDDIGCPACRITTACQRVELWLNENLKDSKRRIANTHSQRLEFLYFEAISAAMRMEDQIDILNDDEDLSYKMRCDLRAKLSNQAETHRLAAIKYMESARKIWGVDAPIKTAATNVDGDGPAELKVSYSKCTREELDSLSKARSIHDRLSQDLQN